MVWRVYEDYEVRQSEEGTEFVQVAGKDTAHEAAAIDAYEPITDTPYLFLEFARLVESKSTGEALSGWIHRYGVPGFSDEGIWAIGDPFQQSVPNPFHNDKGGTLDSFEYIWAIAWEANESLLLYEAATSGDVQKLEQILFSDDDEGWVSDRWQSFEAKAEATAASWREILVSEALFQLVEYASGALTSYCYPVISYPREYSHILEDGTPPITLDKLSRGWGARNLVGAMGLQFYWLITSNGELDRCKYCGRIISYAPSVPAGEEHKVRKPRKDKEFCDSRCRQNYHYHNRIKPARQD